MWRAPHVSVALVAGVAAGVVTTFPACDLIAMALATASIAVVIDRPRRREIALLACLFVTAAADGAAVRDRAIDSPLQSWFSAFAPEDRAPDVVLVHGVLAADASPVEAGVRLVIEVDRIRVGAAWQPMVGRLLAHVSGESAAARVVDWTAGRGLVAPVLVRRPQTWRNPGSPGERWQQLRRTTDLTGTIKSAALVTVERGRWWDEAGALVRRHVRRAAAAHVAPRSLQSASIVAAILIGDRAGLTGDVQQRLQAAGTYHVIAISGGNVALLTAASFLCLRLMVRSPRLVSLLTIAIVVCYGWLVGDEPSVRRAVTGACLYLGADLFGLRPRALYALLATATIIALTDPLTTIDTGAWLSFGATLGIVLCAARFVRWATTGADGMIDQGGIATRFRRILHRLWLVTLGLFSATLAAEFVLLPISVQVFSRVTLFGLVLNFVAIPAMAVVEMAGLVTAALAGWWNQGAGIAGRVADLAASALVGSSRAVDAAPWLVWRVPPTSLIWIASFYAAAGVVLALRGWRWSRKVAAAIATVSLAIIVQAPGVELAGPRAGRLRVTMLDVGQGDSILVQFPGGHSLLIDAGGAPGGFDIGGRVVTPAVWASGVRRLDWFAFTHADGDHIGGALSAVRDLQPREIWEGIPVPPNAERRALRAAAEARHIVWRQLLAGHSFEVGSVAVEIIYPPLPDWERQRVRNDDSLVMRIRFADVEFLLTGDAGQEFERRTAADTGVVPALRLLKVGHHGSRSSSSMAFLERIHPQIGLISVGRGNLFGHPAPDVLARYDDLDAIVFRTDRDGAVVIESDGASVDVRTVSGRRWKVDVKRR